MKLEMGCKSRSACAAIVADSSRSGRVRGPAGLLVLAALSLLMEPALGQITNQITTINPNSAAQGTTGLLVAFTLDTDVPPAPPAGVMPNSVMIGTITGTSVTHSSQYIVTATFNIPAGEPTGAKDATINFTTPNGTLVFSKAGGFTVTAGANMPPSITQQPQSQTVPPGGSVTFIVAASGTAPLSYQWQRDDGDITGATSTSFAIDPVALTDAGDYRCVVTNDYGTATSNEAVLTVAELPTGGYPVVDTGQSTCYNNTQAMTCPQPGQAFYGQDSQCAGYAPSFTLSSDGLTVYDNITRLTWQHTPDTNGDGSIRATDKLTWAQAQARPAVLNAANCGGFSDWRLPTIKELYSLIDFRGTDPSGCTNEASCPGIVPFIDRNYFQFAYGDTSAGERLIDSQYASSTLYVSTAFEQDLFGVNFADGRIKGYGLTMPGGGNKTFFVQCVRGNTDYGINNFANNGDGTVTDRATGLMWTQSDSGSGMNWESTLAWVQTKNAVNYLGYNDWRLPNAKELQSIVDYTRSPDTTNSAAIDPIFTCTQITNEPGQADYPWYWSGTTHAQYTGSGAAGAYVCFGRALGYMNSTWVDVHGAGCQRSDPKSGSLSNWAYAPYGYYNSIAPQGDAIRIFNYVRLVRGPVAPAGCLGDANCDGVVTWRDIDYFVAAMNNNVASWEAMFAPGIPSCPFANNDVDGDGTVSWRDIDPFVAQMGTTCP